MPSTSPGLEKGLGQAVAREGAEVQMNVVLLGEVGCPLLEAKALPRGLPEWLLDEGKKANQKSRLLHVSGVLSFRISSSNASFLLSRGYQVRCAFATA